MAQEEQVQQSVPEGTPELTIVDLQNIRAIIDVATRRGAFGAAEMSAIGNVFNRLEAFLKAAAPAETTAETEADTAATAA